MLYAILAAALVAADTAAPAAESPPPRPRWERTVDASLMTTQNAYSDSWTGGETGSFSWAANLAVLAQKQLSPRLHQRNSAKLAFGQTMSQEEGTKRWRAPAKSTDLIDLETILRLTLGLAADPFASLRLETQFRDGSDPSNIRSLNPAVLTASLGAARAIMKGPDRELITRLGLAVKERINRDQVTDPATGARETFRDRNGGLESVTDYKTPVFSDKVKYVSKLSVYRAFYYSDAWKLEGLPNENYWKAPDVNWENALNASVSKYLMVSLAAQLLYDKEVDLRGRFKETLSLGLTYSLK